MATLTVDNNGQACAVNLADVSGLDALVYRALSGEELDHRLGAIIGQAAVDPDGLCLADRAVVVWLWTRHNVDTDAALAAVASTVFLMPASPASAGGSDAPGVES